MNVSSILYIATLVLASCTSRPRHNDHAGLLVLKHNSGEGTFSVLRSGGDEPLLVHNARSGTRPYIHPLVAPDGQGVLTEYSPGHHKHQTGIYWGLKQVNGRDYFMNLHEDYYRRVSAAVLQGEGTTVRWKTVYDLLDESGVTILTETQTWAFAEGAGKYLIDLEWRGEAKVNVTMGKFYVGGLFLRMPWRRETGGMVVNSEGQRNGEAEGRRAKWNDIGVPIAGRTDFGHIAVLDHPDNTTFPTPWRVDNELGVGPSRQILGDWTIPKGEQEVIRYRLVVYTGDFDEDSVNQWWNNFAHDP